MANPLRDQHLVETGWLAEHLNDPGVRIVDMRGRVKTTTAEDGSQTADYLDAREDYLCGHIPGAVNLPLADLLTGDGLVPAAALRRKLAAVGAGPGIPVGAYCGSGVVAAHLVLALEAAGVPAALYAGSWSDWVADLSRPVATGPT